MKVKLSEWAKQSGISYKTAQRWFYSDKMPVPTDRTPTGRIMVVLEEPVGKNRAKRAIAAAGEESS